MGKNETGVTVLITGAYLHPVAVVRKHRGKLSTEEKDGETGQRRSVGKRVMVQSQWYAELETDF